MKELKAMCLMVKEREKYRMGIGGVSHPTYEVILKKIQLMR
jgi:hypothetical protein